MTVGSYVGNGTDNRSISGVGFQPGYVIVRPEAILSNQNSALKTASSGVSTDLSMDFYASANDIQALQADGFQVGSSNQANQSGKTCYWAAFGT